MIRNRNLAVLLSTSALWLTACATAADEDKGGADVPDRDQAIQVLQQETGAPVSVELGDNGVTRVLAMTPRFHAIASNNDPVVAATSFVSTNHDAFNLTAAEAAATGFKITRVDTEARTGLSHVTLQRTIDGVPIWQGAITVHMDSANAVFRAMGQDNYHVALPTNQRVLTPAQAANAAGTLMGLGDLGLTVLSSDADRTVFSSAKTVDDIHVTQQVFPVDGGSQFAYQVVMPWNDEHKQLQFHAVLVNATDGNLLEDVNLVHSFTGTVFTASPGANPQGDPRTTNVSFDGNPAASPNGWVGTARKTIGNNAVAATDLNANNTVSTNETQPTADANNAFVFPYSAQTDAAQFKAAAVANAFWLVNDYHDRTYLLGFTEASGNFQTSNFGKGGAQNDEVQVDAQDGSGTNNANFGTPPDGQRPRMQMFLFNIAKGSSLRQDGDFDPSVIYHENTHGVSNRLVGGGSTNCLNNLQSGGMGEGWGDFMGGSFLGNPVVGAYVTGNATIGIRAAPMDNSPFTYADIKNGTLAEVHDAGELWAATLWQVRNQVGKATAEQLVISGMKLTPCNPSMISARDAIIQADANLNGGANRCKLFTAFASKAMGSGAASPNDRSTTQITTSTALPADCAGGGGGGGTTTQFTSTDVPKNIPDNNQTGIRSNLPVSGLGATVTAVSVSTNITHTFRGDLIIQLVAPNGQVATLSNRAGGGADNFVATDLAITGFTGNLNGTWQLFVRDVAAVDTGRINSFSLKITSN